jgi:hypothetical protein
MKSKWTDPEYRKRVTARMSIASKAKWADPAYRQKTLSKSKSPAALEKRKNTYIAKKQEMRKIFVAAWQDPASREARCLAVKIKANSTDLKQKNLASLKTTGKPTINIPKYVAEHPRAVHVKLRDPSGRVWEIHNLNKFVIEHPELFEPKHLEFNKIGHPKAAQQLRRLTAKKSGRSTAIGWTLVSDTEVFYNSGEDLIERQKHEIHSI